MKMICEQSYNCSFRQEKEGFFHCHIHEGNEVCGGYCSFNNKGKPAKCISIFEFAIIRIIMEDRSEKS